MHNIVLVFLATALLAVLLSCEHKEVRKGVLTTKTILSCLFVLTAIVQPHPSPGYYHRLLPGLVLCLGGDVCLALRQKGMFLVGLVFFLWGHVFYIFAFLSLTQANSWTWIGSPVFLAVSGIVYLRLKPYLGKMQTPVLLYLIVITIMVLGAWTVLGDSRLTRCGRITVSAGAVSFYCSDVFVARDRFWKREFFNRLCGLPLYYAGQFLLAFSAAAHW
ncbi:MAG TPA: lysoplasmalogenase [Syntrophobacteria bacterium]|nr:lysoplasmalogenase [Syntrophobacteria bacterium]